MRKERERFAGFWSSAEVCVWVALVMCVNAPAQQPASEGGEERARQLWNTKFLQKRPAAPSPGSSGGSANAPAAPTRAPMPASAEAAADALVGITFWRLRDSRSGDDQTVRFSEGGREGTWTPERMEAETPVAAGEKIRVGIETARSGYLYVIDRELYSDGSFSTPLLIFPTARTRGGNNVTAGRLIEIPAWTDNPPYFTLRMSRPDQIAEVLTVLVTPTPLPELQNASEAMQLSPQQVASWESRWGGQVTRLKTGGGVGMAYTKAEKEAGTVTTRFLTQEDPLPQALYYLEKKPADPLLVNIRLLIGK